jgi:hypothetical protein
LHFSNLLKRGGDNGTKMVHRLFHLSLSTHGTSLFLGIHGLLQTSDKLIFLRKCDWNLPSFWPLINHSFCRHRNLPCFSVQNQPIVGSLSLPTLGWVCNKNLFFSVNLWFCVHFTLQNILTILGLHCPSLVISRQIWKFKKLTPARTPMNPHDAEFLFMDGFQFFFATSSMTR